jgi:hypothetical protein
MQKRVPSPDTQDETIRIGYGEKYTIGLMPVYEHTVFCSGTRGQKTTRKNAHKPHIGL